MMNVVVPSSECSSGCESGWTLYLEHSISISSDGVRNTSFGENQQQDLQKMSKFEDQDLKHGYLFGDQEEDLSMVSDASSGRPHFDHHDIDEEEDEEEDDDLCNNNSGRLRKPCMKSFAHETQCWNIKADDFALDDTASSHIFSSMKIEGIHRQNNQGASFERFIDYSSQGYSATHVQGRSFNFQEHNGYIQSPYSTKRRNQPNPVGLDSGI